MTLKSYFNKSTANDYFYFSINLLIIFLINQLAV